MLQSDSKMKEWKFQFIQVIKHQNWIAFSFIHPVHVTLYESPVRHVIIRAAERIRGTRGKIISGPL